MKKENNNKHTINNNSNKTREFKGNGQWIISSNLNFHLKINGNNNLCLVTLIREISQWNRIRGTKSREGIHIIIKSRVTNFGCPKGITLIPNKEIMLLINRRIKISTLTMSTRKIIN